MRLRCRTIRAKTVCHHRAGTDITFAQQFSHEPEAGRSVTLGLNRDFKHLTFVIDRPPQVEALTAHRDEHFVQIHLTLGLGRDRGICRTYKAPNLAARQRTVL